MRSPAPLRPQSALLSGFAAFVFFTLVWHFAAHWGLGLALGLAALMGAVVAMGTWRLARWAGNSGARR
jgi:hypothetical protein